MIDELKLTLTPREFLERFESWDRGALPGALELLKALASQYLLACLSNNNPIHWARHRRMGVLDRFQIKRALGIADPMFTACVIKPELSMAQMHSHWTPILFGVKTSAMGCSPQEKFEWDPQRVYNEPQQRQRLMNKRMLRIMSAILVLAAVGVWLATGANRGWTKTSVLVKKTDEVTGITVDEYQTRFVPGVDLLGAALLGSALLAGASFLLRKPQPQT